MPTTCPSPNRSRKIGKGDLGMAKEDTKDRRTADRGHDAGGESHQQAGAGSSTNPMATASALLPGVQQLAIGGHLPAPRRSCCDERYCGSCAKQALPRRPRRRPV